MKLMDSHSHLGGLEYLLVHEPQLWNEVAEAVESAESEHGIRQSLAESGWDQQGTRMLKRGVSIEFPGRQPESAIVALYPLQLARYMAGEINVGIEIMPSGRFELTLSETRRLGRGTPAVPLVIIGIAP